MCGYISILRSQQSTFDLEKIELALQALHHRGPDEKKIWVDPSGYAAFGYVRLSLVGLSNGSQPIMTPNQELIMMVNGEFYEYQGIKQQLQKQGCVFKTESDSEIAIYLYELYGIDGLKSLKGEFSLVIFDRRRRVFIAMRDRLGVKPLYYTQYKGDWYFASEIKGLLAAGVPAIWDLESYATRGFILRDRTLFKGIRSVQPGHLMIIDNNGYDVKKYWDLNFCTNQQEQQLGSIDEGNIIERVRQKIQHAVNIRLQADVDIGVGLSGGIDSSAVLGMATALSNKRLNAFHLSFSADPDYDEYKFAKIAADYNNATLNTIEITNNDLADNFLSTIWHTEMPFFNAHSVAKFILCKAIGAAGTKAILTGEGADEIFCGYPHFKRDTALYDPKILDNNYVKKLLAQINESEMQPDKHNLPKDLLWLTQRLSHGVSWLETQTKLVQPITQLYSDEYKDDYGYVEGYRKFWDYLDNSRLDNIHPVHQSMYLLAKSCLPNIVLTTLGDRMEMAGSIEGRPPLIDHELVEFICNLPLKLKLKNGIEKYILREAMKPYVPDVIYQRKKHYFRAPPTLSRTGNCKLYQLVLDQLSSDTMKRIPFFNYQKIQTMLYSLDKLSQQDRLQMDYTLTEITGLCLMQHKFGLVAP